MKLDKIVQDFRDERSQEMYGKNEYELTIAERQRLDEYIKDYNNPTWKDVAVDGIKTNYSINSIGELKNSVTDKILKSIIDKDGYCMYYFICDKKTHW